MKTLASIILTMIYIGGAVGMASTIGKRADDPRIAILAGATWPAVVSMVIVRDFVEGRKQK